MLVWNAVMPEFQMVTHIRKEDSYRTVSSWGVRVSEVCLPAFMRCCCRLIRKMVMNEGTTQPPCKYYCHWYLETKSNGKDLQVNDPISKDNSTDCPTGAGIDPQPEGRTCDLKMPSPMKLNIDWILQAVRITYCGIHGGSWSKAQAREYLRTCNVKSSTVELVIEIVDIDKAEGIFNPVNDES